MSGYYILFADRMEDLHNGVDILAKQDTVPQVKVQVQGLSAIGPWGQVIISDRYYVKD